MKIIFYVKIIYSFVIHKNLDYGLILIFKLIQMNRNAHFLQHTYITKVSRELFRALTLESI